MITITEHPEGCVLPIRAQPGAREARIVGAHAGSVKIAVTAPADQGKANKSLIQLLCEVLGLKPSQLEILTGQTSRQKRFLIRGLTPPELQNRIANLIPHGQ